MVYNGIAYVVKRLAQRDFFAGMTLARSTLKDGSVSRKTGYIGIRESNVERQELKKEKSQPLVFYYAISFI